MLKKYPLKEISKNFVPKEYRKDQHEQYHDKSRHSSGKKYRSLSSEEIEILVKNNNTAESWDKLKVTNNFDPSLVRNCDFWGLVRLGDLTPSFLEYHELRLPVGLNNCSIISCDIGNDVVLRNVHHLSHYIIGDHAILFNIQEMITVNHAKFGVGIVKDGEPEDVRVWLEVANENGGRKILPFVGMLPADAYLWSSFRGDHELLSCLKKMTDKTVDSRRGYYGVVGNDCVIKNSRIIKDVNIGPHCYIKGANKLKNLTILSSESEPSQIGEGVELVNGIIGFNNRIFYGVKAVRFLTSRNVQLKYGARLLNSFLGPNSTLSCCEILNNLIYGFHEQHHNNSFLIATTVMGQSNIAAGATIGSNHNSRANDGEIIANRGFWPGLETNFKHNCRFSSFNLIAKGSYMWEINNPFPFSLISTGKNNSELQILPGYWFKYNMYALARNTWKFQNRDSRKIKEQNIELDYLAPDTVEEMEKGRGLLFQEIQKFFDNNLTAEQLLQDDQLEADINLYLPDIYKRGVAFIRKPVSGYRLYSMMIEYYGARELKSRLEKTALPSNPIESIRSLKDQYTPPDHYWHNIGGQLFSQPQIDRILQKIKSGDISTWSALHDEYDRLWIEYPGHRSNHGLYYLLKLYNISIHELDAKQITHILKNSTRTAQTLLNWTIDSRQKDFDCAFRKATYRDENEMQAVLGNIDDIPFIREIRTQTQTYCDQIQQIIDQLSD